MMKKFFRTVWQAGYPILIENGVNLLLTFIILMLYASMFYSANGLYAINIAADLLDENIMLLTGVVSLVMIPLFMLMIRKDTKKYGDEEPDLKMNLRIILMCVIGACGASLAGSFMMSMLGMHQSDVHFEQYVEIFNDTAPVAVVLVSIILTPLLEELLFRGLVFKRICHSYGATIAAVVSSLVYAFTFGGIARGIFGFIMGLVYSYAYTKTDRIWVPSVMHMTASTFMILLDFIIEEYGLAVTGREAVTAVIGVIAGITASVCYVLYLQKTGDDVIRKTE